MLTEMVRLALGETLHGEGAGMGDDRDSIKMFSGIMTGQIQEVPF
jgi:hypothetical protein